MNVNNGIIVMSKIIEFVHRQHLEVTSQQLAKLCEVEEKTILPVLAKLTKRGWLRYDSTSKLFKHGLGLLVFTNEGRLRRELIRQCRHIMQRLSEECNQTVMLSVIDGFSAICIHKIEPKNAVYITARVGRESPLHAGSSGRVLLAHAPEIIKKTVLSRPLPQITPLTITSKEVLSKSLSEIRNVGFCCSVEEVDPGAAAISAPILDNSDNIIASLSIIGTRFAYEKERLLWKETLLKSVKDIKNSL